MDNIEIRKQAIKELSEETGIADYFVEVDLHDEFVDRCILIALKQVKNNSVLDDVSQQSELFEIIADRLEKELPFELETIKRETLIKIISNCG